MPDSSFTGRRITRSYCQSIAAPPDRVFRLLCPVREAEWLDGFQYTMIHSQSGLVEEGAVFTTPSAGEEDSVWIVTRHEIDKRLVEFARVTPGSRVSVLRIAVRPAREGRSFVDVVYTYTGLTSEGNAFLDALSEEVFLRAVMLWEDSMNHWLKTGQQLRRSGSA